MTAAPRRFRPPHHVLVWASAWALVWGALALLLAVPASAEPSSELTGKTYDYEWDGRDIKRPERAWFGRAYVPPKAARAKRPVPLVVFLHGLNAALIKYRWMGGGHEGDVRRIVGDMVDDGKVTPLVVAGPSSIVASQVSKGASWNHFDLDRFVDRTISRLSGLVAIDEDRIVVAGHSGAGCSTAGGLAKVGDSRRRLHAIVSIDTCMAPPLAKLLADADARTNVLVTWQTISWSKRPFSLFTRTFEREAAAHPPKDGVLRVLEKLEPTSAPHDATVKLTFEKYLPELLPPREE